MTIGWVQIVCDDSTHPSKKSVVTHFFRPDSGDDRSWQEVVGRSARLRREGEVVEIAGIKLPPKADKPEAYQGLMGDSPGLPIPGQGRTRYRLACELCGRTVPVRMERLATILDRLADNSVRSISLNALAARLQ